MTKGKGRGWFETPGPDGVAVEHQKAANKRKSKDLSNAEVKPSNEAETIKKKIDTWNPNEDTVSELDDLIQELKDTGDKDYDLSFLPVAEEFIDFVDEHSSYPVWTADYNGDLLVGSGADEIENVNDFDDYHEAKFDFDVDQVKQIEEYVGAKIEERYGDGDEYKFDDGTAWLIFKDMDDAEDYAKKGIINNIEYDPEMIGTDRMSRYLFISDTDRRILANEEADNYVDNTSMNDIMVETGFDDKSADLESEIDDMTDEITGLEDEIEELEEDEEDKENEIQNKINKIENKVTEKEVERDNLEDEAKEKRREDKYEEIYSELDNPVQYFVEDHGMYNLEQLMKASFIMIDENELAGDMVSEEGVGQMLGTYNGDYEELENDMIIIRTS